MVLLVFAGLIVLTLLLRVGIRLARRWFVVRKLRGDWWPAFEREFRAYASTSWQAAREAEQQR